MTALFYFSYILHMSPLSITLQIRDYMSNSKVYTSFILLFVLLVSLDALNCALLEDEEISVYNNGVHDELISSNFHIATYSNNFLPPIPPSKPFPGPNTVEPPPPPRSPPPQRSKRHRL
ncbi:hypothetical protein PIB30_064789 [Stylosanthes scabra]|uniref:Transmembrane protein n=1 Tax=Stylosanthes scabra TaxID=79078 RepID=A0ABU6UKS4_9FABA|nr:hypothetical protein [Stylosanthes scabra]